MLEVFERLFLKIDIPKKKTRNNKIKKVTFKEARKPQNSEVIKITSHDVAKSILEEINSQYLRSHLPEI
jgi:hypothetical protein